MIAELANLGVGLGFRERFRADVMLNRASIDFLEITADHYLDAHRSKLDELRLLKEHFTLIPHSLDLSLGSAEGVDEAYLEKLAALIEFIDPPWFSDHVCFTRSGGVAIGHLAPVPQTREALDVFARNIGRVKSLIKKPLVLENISYLMHFPSSEMSESEFLTRVTEESDCGILLDVTNLHINSRNFDFCPRKFLDEIPLDRVVQLHFVGSRRQGKRLIDAHSDRTEEDIWKLFNDVAGKCEVKGAVLERDGNFPPFTEILDELDTARRILNSSRAI
jgi:uncharacterized protein (UPF0276 family)